MQFLALAIPSLVCFAGAIINHMKGMVKTAYLERDDFKMAEVKQQLAQTKVAIDVLAVLSIILVAAYIIRAAVRNIIKIKFFCAVKFPYVEENEINITLSLLGNGKMKELVK